MDESRVLDLVEKIGVSPLTMQLTTTPAEAFVIVAQMQLALRHPANTGESTEIARQAIARLTDAICEAMPEISDQFRALIAEGFKPESDLSREEFSDLEQFFGLS